MSECQVSECQNCQCPECQSVRVSGVKIVRWLPECPGVRCRNSELSGNVRYLAVSELSGNEFRCPGDKVSGVGSVKVK
jgi:hypothetical protein